MATPGIQFGHIQTYARKVSANHKRKGNAWSVSDIAKEASRDPEHSKHVENAKDPIHIAGFPVHELEQRMDTFIQENKVTVMVGGKPQERKARDDAHTLMTGVYSWPEHMSQWENMDKQRLQNFIDDTLAFHEAEFGHVHSAAMHIDEEYPHLHIYTMDPAAKSIHPGEKAKKEAYALHDDKKVANKAYRDAMSAFQDRYFETVGLRNGLERLGPKRMRVSPGVFRKDKAARIERADNARKSDNLIEQLENRKGNLQIEVEGLESKRSEALTSFEGLKKELNLNQEKYKKQNSVLKQQEAEIKGYQNSIDEIKPKLDDLTKQYDNEVKSAQVKIAKIRKDAAVAIKAAEEKAQKRTEAAAKATGFMRSMFAGAKQMLGFETRIERELKAEKEAIERLMDIKLKEKDAHAADLFKDIQKMRQRAENLDNKLLHAEHDLTKAKGQVAGQAETIQKGFDEVKRVGETLIRAVEHSTQTKRSEWDQKTVDAVLKSFDKESRDRIGLKGFDTVANELVSRKGRGLSR